MVVPVHAAGGIAAARGGAGEVSLRAGRLGPAALVAAEAPHGRPVRHGRAQGRSERREVAGTVNHLPPDDRQQRGHVSDLIAGDAEVAAVEHGKVGEHPLGDKALPALLVRKQVTFSVIIRSAVSRSSVLRSGVMRSPPTVLPVVSQASATQGL